MSSTATVALAVLPALVAVGGTLAIARMQINSAKETREADARAVRRANAGGVLGRIRVLLLDMSPDIIALNMNGRGDQAMPGLTLRWEDLREELAVFSESDGDPAVMDASRKLIVAVGNTLNRLGGVLYDQKTHSAMGPEMLEAAREHYGEARELVDELSALARA